MIPIYQENNKISKMDCDIYPLNLSLKDNQLCNIEINTNNVKECQINCEDIISISSEECSQRTPINVKKLTNGKKAATERKNKSEPIKNGKLKRTPRKLPDHLLGTPKTKIFRKRKNISKSEIKKCKDDKPENNIEIKTEEKCRRRLTKYTNLKTISYKNHPRSQRKMQDYFDRTLKTNNIGYFETFEKSEQQSKNLPKSTIENVDACLSVQFEEANIKVSLNELKLEQVPNENKTTFTKHNQSNNSVTRSIDEKSESENNHVKDHLLVQCIEEVSLQQQMINTTLRPINRNSIDVQSQKTQMESNQSSKSYSLSETAQVRTRSSLRLSKESKFSKESEKTKVQKLIKKAKKRLSFRCEEIAEQLNSKADDVDLNTINNCEVSIDALQIQSDTDISLEFVSQKLHTNNMKNDCNMLPEKNVITILSDTDSDELSENNAINSKRSSRTENNLTSNKKKCGKQRRTVECPSYKIVEGTTFAVDAFRFGNIEGVSHYFLSHYHGDHYIGLKKTFSMPIFMSSITARLVKAFIQVNPDYIHVIDPNDSVLIDGIEVTAIDANHCPGAVMFAFKFPNGQVTLHTGDFRASFEMESNPYFWNNKIDTIYLDTTYLHNNYDFKSQSDSIEDVIETVEKFQLDHIGKKILYVSGSYVIGKEKVWAAIAKQTNEFVYTHGTRRKALECIRDPELMKYVINDPKIASIHVLAMGDLSYDKLVEYWKLYDEQFDIILAIRPSGWEKKSRPQYRGKINIVGIEYSEHSSCSELRRFIRFLQPIRIISTVPYGSDLSKTCKIPISWFDNRVTAKQIPYQQSITNFTKSIKKTDKPKNHTEEPTCSKYLLNDRYEYFVSPIKSKTSSRTASNQINYYNNFNEYIIGWMS